MDRRKDAAILTVEFAAFSARTRKELTAEGEALLRFAEPDAGSFQVRLGL